jgi:hypothetical protein
MPLLFVTYHDPQTDHITTAAIETALSPRVFRAMILAEGLTLPDGDAVLPACLRGVSSRRPAAIGCQPEPAAAEGKREPAEASVPAPARPRPGGSAPGRRVEPATVRAEDALTEHPPQRPGATPPEPPAEADARGGAATARPNRARKRA